MEIIKKNSSSPFLLQRSIVDQGGSGGAYEEGGYNPNAAYNGSAVAASIAGMGKMLGAGLASQGKDEDVTKTKGLDPKTVKAKAVKEFGVKKDSKLYSAAKDWASNEEQQTNDLIYGLGVQKK